MKMSGMVFGYKLVMAYLCALQIHEVIPDLEEDADEVD